MADADACDLWGGLGLGISSDDGPYRLAIITCGAVALLCFVVSSISKNYSQVDKLWSIIPVVYAWFPVCDSRTLLMACLVTIWGIRLTWNFNRRGGYKWPLWDGDEDYRWEVIRTGGLVKVLANPIAWILFNFGFVSVYQNLLLLLIVAPSFVVYTMATSANCTMNYVRDLNILDVIATLTFLTCVLIESVADNQQFAFQTEKYRRQNTGNPELLVGNYADGFCQSGMYKIVRKPNYAAEQMIWVSFFLFSIAAQKEVASIWNWSAVGSVLLVQLFQASGWFTEKITVAKYSSYKEYMKRVPQYIPNMLDCLKMKQE